MCAHACVHARMCSGNKTHIENVSQFRQVRMAVFVRVCMCV